MAVRRSLQWYAKLQGLNVVVAAKFDFEWRTFRGCDSEVVGSCWGISANLVGALNLQAFLLRKSLALGGCGVCWL